MKIVSVEEASDEDELEEEDDVLGGGRQTRWERVGIAAAKQSLRSPCVPLLHMLGTWKFYTAGDTPAGSTKMT